MGAFKLSFLCICIFLIRAAGPDAWNGSCGTGTSQSPVDITLSSTELDTTLGAFTFTNYDQIGKYNKLKNNGHTVQVDMLDGSVTLSGGGLEAGNYILAQFHFHWGPSSTTGAEHFIEGSQAPLEVHFVHYLSSHGDLANAASQANGLAVLGFLFEISASDNSNLNFLVDLITNVSNKDQESTTFTSEPSLNSMIGNVNITKFVRYSGSLTTPTCDESVQWTIFTDKIPISETQMTKIRATYSDTNGTTLIGKNFRPLQTVGSRTIKISYAISAGTLLQHMTWLLLLPAFCF